MIHVGDLEQVEFVEPATIRLISTAYINEPALTPLADNDKELEFLEEIEGLTSARRSPDLPVPSGVSQDELLRPGDGYGWSYVNAAFCYTRAGGNRFNGTERGAWYATYGKDAVKTAQAEVAWHLTRELDATGVYDNLTAYRELLAGFTTQFYKLPEQSDEALLSPDPEIAYPAGQALAVEILAQGGNGLLYPSVRRAGGKCLVAFHPRLVQNIRQGETWLFEWKGKPEPEIRKQQMSS